MFTKSSHRARKAPRSPYLSMVEWNDPKLREVTALRLKSPGSTDPDLIVQSCTGVLKDGTEVRVVLPFAVLPKTFWLSTIIEFAKRAGDVYVRALGFDRKGVVSILWT